jgi:hypothetical protein
LNRDHTLKLIFGFDVAHAQQRGQFVHNTKLMVLLLLTFGQFLIVALTAFVLWLAGQYGEPPNWRWLRSLRGKRLGVAFVSTPRGERGAGFLKFKNK